MKNFFGNARLLEMCKIFALGSLITLASSPAFGISSRHDIDDDEIVVDDSEYPGIISLFGDDDCSATLVHQSYLITVAHCAQDLDSNQVLKINGEKYHIKKVLIHKKWRDARDEYDIALIQLATPVEDVTPIPVYRGVLHQGDHVTLLGRGMITDGLRGEAGGKPGGQLRRATNTIYRLKEHFIVFKFFRPENEAVTPLEGIGVSGDSGGPVLIRGEDGREYIIGMNSWGSGNDNTVGKYDMKDYQTRIERYFDFIDQYIK